MAKFNSAWLISKRQFRSLTGVEADTFRKLVERLRPHWRERIEAPKNRSGRPWGVGGLEDHLLVLLIVYRCAITQDFMACLYQTDKSIISRSLRRIEAVAARVLGVKRAIRVSRQEAEALIIENGGDKLDHGSGGFSCRGRIKTLPPVAFDLFGDGRREDVHRGSLLTSSACLSC